MPRYEYACRNCAEHIEVVQSFTEDPLETCGLCGGSLRKVFSAAGIIFKGSGYYVTDTRDAKAASSGGKGGGEKSDASSESGSSEGGSSEGGSSEGGSSESGSSDSSSSSKSESGSSSSSDSGSSEKSA